MRLSPSSSLLNISPIDGRYTYLTEELSVYFSEYALFKYRILVEIKYLIALSNIGIIRKITKSEIKFLNKIYEEFDIKECKKIKKIEKVTRHDKKAIEYYLKDLLLKSSLKDITDYLHFALTSDDVSNIAVRFSIKKALQEIIIPSIKEFDKDISIFSKKYKNLPMLARTHGQPAISTTLGKEFLVFSSRLERELIILKNAKFYAKLNGAVGNYNAHYFAFPKINWPKFSKSFVKEFDLEINMTSTQIAPYEDIIYFFQTLQRINGIILDFNQDMWRYISDGWFTQENIKEKVGSSTMPQKINPINFEQSEGNIIIANSLIEGFTNKLPLSRLQRDLSDSTISRNFGVCLAHCLLSYKLSKKGLSKISPNKDKIKADLNEDWSILSEAIQIYLKREGFKNGYEISKKLFRGQKIDQNEFYKIVDKLPLNESRKKELKKLTPENYIGLAPEIARGAI